jgi:hypothetical protein
VSCVDQDGAVKSSTGDTGSLDDVEVQDGDAVVCTISNALVAPAAIRVEKVTRSQSGVVFEDDQPFTFSITGGGVDASPTLDTDSRSENIDASAGPYDVTEFADKVYVRETAVPAHWTLADIECVQRDAQSGVESAGANVRYGTGTGDGFAEGATSGFDPGDTVAEIDIASREDMLCRFTNVPDEADVQVRKVTTSGGRTVTGDGPFRVTLDGSGIGAEEDLDTNPGTSRPSITQKYSTDDEFHETYVTERSLPAGWTIADISCEGDNVRFGTGEGRQFDPGATDGFDSGDTVARVDLDPGDSVLCTFRNDAEVGKIEVVKVNSGGPPSDRFAFTPSSELGAGFALAGGERKTFENVVFGTYTVSEADADGYRLSSIACSDDDSATEGRTATIRVRPGETVRCTFTNTRNAVPPAPVQQVAASTSPPPRTPTARRPGSAALRAPAGCRKSTFRVRVIGREIRRVTFYLDGRKLRTIRSAQATPMKRNGAATQSFAYTIRIDPRRLDSERVHRVRARVVFTTASGTRTRTLRMAFQRCLQRTVRPRFTG